MIFSFKDKAEYFFLKFFYLISRFLSLKHSSFLGGILLSLYGLVSSRNKIALSNLSIAFPKLPQINKKKIIRRMWFNFGRLLGEYSHLPSIKTLNNKNVEIQGIENLLEPLRLKKGCIFFSAHLGNWELTSHPLTEQGYKISFIYRAPNNKLVDDLLRNIRLEYGVDLIKKGPEGAKDCIKILKKKENLGMLVDQKMNDGVPINFFGKKAMTASAVAKLALKFKCPIVPAVCLRVKGIKFKIIYYKKISYKKIKELKTEEKIINFINKYVEQWVRENPDQWIWVHNRW